jgi:AraC-like DNA-binding protein
MPKIWKPPFHLHAAGRGLAKDSSYYNDVSVTDGPQRLLLKHTLSGTGVLYVEEKRFELEAGDLFIIERPGPYVYCYENGDAPWKFEYVSIVYNSKDGILPINLKKTPVFSLAEHEGLQEQLQKLIKLRMHEHYEIELAHSALAYQFFLSYVALRSSLSETIPRGVLKMKELISANFTNNISINEYAGRSGYSQEAVTRLFTQQYKISPGKYLLNLRLNKACRLLIEKNMRIQEVSEACGFRSQNYFSRAFMKKLKVSPSEYRSNPDFFSINMSAMI